MTKYLPPSLLALFAPRPPLPFRPPVHAPKHGPLTGVAQYVQHFEDPATVDYAAMTRPEQIDERRARVRQQRAAKRAREAEEEAKKWTPSANPAATGDPRKTLVVARVSYEATERDVEKEFDQFGKIRRVTLVRDREGRPRGYGFVEYEDERGMRKVEGEGDASCADRGYFIQAYKEGDGTKVRGRRVLVDVERGRTTPGFKPRRLGGGLGKTRADKKSKKQLALEESSKKRTRSPTPPRRGGGSARDTRRR